MVIKMQNCRNQVRGLVVNQNAGFGVGNRKLLVNENIFQTSKYLLNKMSISERKTQLKSLKSKLFLVYRVTQHKVGFFKQL